MTGDGENRLAVHLGVIKAVEQVNTAGPRGGQADPEPTGVFGVSTGHEGGGLFMTHLDEADFVLARSKRFHNAVDAIAGQTEHYVNTPVLNGLDQDVATSLCHDVL